MSNEINSRWADIFRVLKSNGISVFSPGIKTGECTEKYVVVKDDGAARHSSFSTNIAYYSVLVYVPRDSFSLLSPYVDGIKEMMKTLYPMIIPTGEETPSFYDDSTKSHMISIMYKNYKKV